jgi:hypothetical protein
VTAASANLNAPVVFKAVKSAGAITADTAIPTWTVVSKDTVNGFNASTGVYTVKVPGDYLLTATFRTTSSDGGNRELNVYKNGNLLFLGVDGEFISGINSTVLTDLKVGDTLDLRCTNTTTSESTDTGTRFQLVRIETSNRVYKTRVAYIKDVQAAGTEGGAFTSGAWRTRVLNTLEGDTSFVSLASNQFTLQPGTYHIEASAPGFSCTGHKALLYNITAAANQIIGAAAYSSAASTYAVTDSLIKGTFSITAATVFEIRHRCETTKTVNGLGIATNVAVSEIYTQVKLEKVL